MVHKNRDQNDDRNRNTDEPEQRASTESHLILLRCDTIKTNSRQKGSIEAAFARRRFDCAKAEVSPPGRMVAAVCREHRSDPTDFGLGVLLNSAA
jgi:hypothetical protein